MEEPQTAVLPLLGLISVALMMVERRMTGCFYVHPSEALMVSAEAVEAVSQSVTVHSTGERWGIVILKPSVRLSIEWQ